MPRPKILITGGHITPALAVIPELKKHHLNIIFVGRSHTGRQDLPTKEQELIGESAQFVSFDAPKLHSKPLIRNLLELAKTPGSLLAARRILTTHHPDLILTFGGYLALPIALMAKTLGIPIITHEQTTVLGKTNRILARLSHILALSWPHTQSVPSALTSTTALTGNPLRPEFFTTQSHPSWYHNPHHLPTIYITGGNQGASALNQYILHHLSALTAKYYLIHQTGVARSQADLDKLLAAKQQLPDKQQLNYHLAPWYDTTDVTWLMHHVNLVVSRAGANTITELLVTGTPSILIPLPYSAAGEQQQNAALLENFGLATVLPQPQLSQLTSLISKLIAQPKPQLSSPATKLQSLHTQAVTALTSQVFACLDQHPSAPGPAPSD